MQRSHSPSVRRRRLSVQLRRYREQQGLTAAKAGAALGWPQQKISKIESGEQKRLPPDELDLLLDLYEVVDAGEREALQECARLAKERGWWSKYRNAFPGGLPDFEAEASVIKTFEGQVVPGLLQTPEYAAEVFRAYRIRQDEEIERLVEARMQRQAILNKVDPPYLTAVIDEAALRRRVGGPDVMATQLRHLKHTASRHNIDIYVLPFAAGAHAATTGSFMILDFPDPMDASLGYVETPTSSLYIEDEGELREFNSMMGRAQSAALSPAGSLSLIDKVIESLEE
ncbi:helix-turn-helix domain-containing protein [Nocardiopsis halophila]|uniref:helix-turn-helix domain-containing protein n=1 Tax=Nocardiopsis halophila TaxID=141692 RepID=UPI0004770D63|nr:helix-turn-helix transcriptional regulator [Nocardiopsis halophila]